MLAALRTAPLHISTLFPDAAIKRAEEEIAHYDNKGQSTSSSSRQKSHFHPYERTDKRAEGRSEAKQERPAWKNIGVSLDEVEARTLIFHHDLPRASSHTNDNHCITRSQDRLLAGSLHTGKTMNTYFKAVNLNVVNVVPSAPGHSPKRELSPESAVCYYKKHRLKYVKGASCVTRLSCVQPVTNVKNVALNLPVGSRLPNFWKTWLDLGAGPKVVQILKEGYTLPFRIRPKLTRSPTVISCYVNPHRNSYLLEALHQLIAKNAVELVKHQTSLGFFNWLFLIPKPRLLVRPQDRSGPTDSRPVAESSGQNIGNTVTTGLSGPAGYVPDRLTNSHRKASSPRPVTHEAHTVASQKPLENTRITRKGDSNSEVPAPSFTMVATGGQHSHRSTVTPNKACSANLYRCIKRRVGRSLKRTHCQRDLVTARKQSAYKLFGTKGNFSSLKRVSRPLCRQGSTCGNRQYYSSVTNKQGRGHEVGHTLCLTMEDLDLVYQTSSNPKSPTHSRPAERGSRQAIPSRPDHSNRMVPPSRGFPSYMQQVTPDSDRPFCHKVQQQVTSVRVTSTGFPGSSSGCAQSPMGRSGRLCLPTSSHLGQSGGEVTGFPLQENHSDCSRVAQHALVLGSMSSQIPLSLPNLLTQPFNQIPHRNLTNLNLHAWLLEPQQSRSRASLKQWQQGLRLLKEDQPDQSMRQSGPFLQSGASLISWTSGHPL